MKRARNLREFAAWPVEQSFRVELVDHMYLKLPTGHLRVAMSPIISAGSNLIACLIVNSSGFWQKLAQDMSKHQSNEAGDFLASVAT